MAKIKLSQQQIGMARGTRTAVLRKRINGLGADDAIPIQDLIDDPKIGLGERHLVRVVSEMRARITIVQDGAPVICVANPKTVRKYERKAAKAE